MIVSEEEEEEVLPLWVARFDVQPYRLEACGDNF